MSNPTEWDRNAVAAILKAHGVKDLIQLVRETVEQAADPTTPEGSEGMRCYFALNGLDDLLDQLEKYETV